MSGEQGAREECLAEKENGHQAMYLTWVHQADGTCYYKCEMCGWIAIDTNRNWVEIAWRKFDDIVNGNGDEPPRGVNKKFFINLLSEARKEAGFDD